MVSAAAALAYAAIAALAVAPRYPCLFAGFVYDDVPAVLTHPVVRLHAPWQAAFALDYWGSRIGGQHTHGSFRPLTTLSFAASAVLGGADLPAGAFPPAWRFRAVSFALHALVSCLVLRLCVRMSGSLPAAAAAAALYAAHPLLSEPVCCVALRGDVFAGLTTLLALEAFTRFVTGTPRGSRVWGWGSLASLAVTLLWATVGTFAKETGVAVLLICLAYGIIAALASAQSARGSDPSARALQMRAVYGAVITTCGAGGLFFLRLAIQGHRMPVFTAFDNISVHLRDPMHRLLTLSFLNAWHLSLFVWPTPLGVDWSGYALAPVTQWDDPRNALTAAVGVVLGGSILVATWAAFTWRGVGSGGSVIEGGVDLGCVGEAGK